MHTLKTDPPPPYKKHKKNNNKNQQQTNKQTTTKQTINALFCDKTKTCKIFPWTKGRILNEVRELVA